MLSTPRRDRARPRRSTGQSEAASSREPAPTSTRRVQQQAPDRGARESRSARSARRSAAPPHATLTKKAPPDGNRSRPRRAPQPRRTPLLQGVEEGDAVRYEDDRDDDRESRQVALDDVRASLRCRREAHPAEPGVPPRVHENQPAEGDAEQYLENGERLKHGAARVSAGNDLQDRVDQLRGDAVFRDVAGGAGLARLLEVGARVRAGQHEDARLRLLLSDLLR